MSGFDHQQQFEYGDYQSAPGASYGEYQHPHAMNAPLGGPMYTANLDVAQSQNPPCALPNYQSLAYGRPAYAAAAPDSLRAAAMRQAVGAPARPQMAAMRPQPARENYQAPARPQMPPQAQGRPQPGVAQAKKTLHFNGNSWEQR